MGRSIFETTVSSPGFVCQPEGSVQEVGAWKRGFTEAALDLITKNVHEMLGSADGWRKGKEGERNEGAVVGFGFVLINL